MKHQQLPPALRVEAVCRSWWFSCSGHWSNTCWASPFSVIGAILSLIGISLVFGGVRYVSLDDTATRLAAQQTSGFVSTLSRENPVPL